MDYQNTWIYLKTPPCGAGNVEKSILLTCIYKVSQTRNTHYRFQRSFMDKMDFKCDYLRY